MYKTINPVVSGILAWVLLLGSYANVQASSELLPLNITGAVYYVATTGSDSNSGTLVAPFKTFAKATSMLGPGSTLYILPGIYNEPLKISNSGMDGAWIDVESTGGTVIIDIKNVSNPAVYVRGSYITLKNLEVKGSNDICVLSSGNYVHISGMVVHDCQTHGIHVTGQHVQVSGNVVYATSLANQARTASSGWGSAIKIGFGGNDILVDGNTAFNNYGEGIASTQGANVVIRGNTVYDNFSVNIYVDNSYDILVEKNLVTCHPNSGFERNGLPASGISMGEEYYSGWGAQLNRVTVRNNIVAFCKHGVYYYGADPSLTNGGLKNSTIVYNTFWGSIDPVIGVEYGTGQTNSLIANNIIWQANNKLVYVANYSGLTLQNNLWKVAPPTAAKGAGDRLGDPLFLATPGYTAQSFALSLSSPAIGGAANIGVATDYFGNQRGPSYEMGALQFLGAIASPTPVISNPTLAPTSLPTQLPTSTALPLPTSTKTSTPMPTLIVPTFTSTSLPPTATSTTVPTLVGPTSTSVSSPKVEIIYNDTNPALIYSENWLVAAKVKAYEGSFKYTEKLGSFVTLSFIGQSISLLYETGKGFGKMDVYIDNQLIATLNQRTPQNQFQKRWDYQGTLSAGQHELKLIFSGPDTLKGSLDAVVVR
jgi:parallel beta-helix repeat protein